MGKSMLLTVWLLWLGLGRLRLDEYFSQAHLAKMLLPPALVIEGLAADQGQKPQGQHGPEMILKHPQPFGTQNIICKGIIHGFVPPHTRQGFGHAPPAARA